VSLQEWAALIGPPGISGAVVWLLYRFFRTAVAAHSAAAEAHSKRADDWRHAYDSVMARLGERDAQISHMISPVTSAITPNPPTQQPPPGWTGPTRTGPT